MLLQKDINTIILVDIVNYFYTDITRNDYG